MLPQMLSTCQSQHFVPNEDIAIARFIRFLKHIDLKKLLSKISDTRQASKIGRISITLLRDSLYAHEPAIHNAEEVFMGYLIV